jgi:hypothetical protein
MTGIEKKGFEQLAEVVNMPTRFECYETIGDIAKLAMLAYVAGSRDACGWIKKEPIKEEE